MMPQADLSPSFQFKLAYAVGPVVWSDRNSCRSALANQVRLVLHTAAYWLMLDIRDAIPRVRDLASAEFTTLRLRLLKVAARIMETRHRVRIGFSAACPEANIIGAQHHGLAENAPPV